MKRFLLIFWCSLFFVSGAQEKKAYQREWKEPEMNQQKSVYPEVQGKFEFRIGDIVGCPGTVVDVPVYISIDSTYKINSFQFYISFPDTSKVEVVTTNWDEERLMGDPVLPYCDPNLDRGSWGRNYVYINQYGGDNVYPCFVMVWVQASRPYQCTPGVPMFKIRVRIKDQGNMQVLPVASSIAFFVENPNNPQSQSVITEKNFNFHSGSLVTPNKPVVFAGKDTIVCVYQKVSLTQARGGVMYEWRELQSTTVPKEPAIQETKAQFPIFYAVEPGHYHYDVKITDKYGCYNRDTIMVTALDRTFKMKSMTRDTLIDSNAIVPLHIDITSLYPGMTVRWLPAHLVADSVLAEEGTHNDGKTYTVPLQLPQLFSINVSDFACRGDYPRTVSVNIRGSKMEAKIDPFPFYRCGENTYNESRTRLNVLIKGGSGNFKYQWRAKNLENELRVLFESTTMRCPSVVFFGKTVFYVDILDVETQEVLSINDTVTVLPFKELKVDLHIDGEEKTYCENTAFNFKAEVENPGSSPVYSWRINGREVAQSYTPHFTSNLLKKGDTVDCIVYSNERCVNNSPLRSNAVVPKIDYPKIMNIEVGRNLKNTEVCGKDFILDLDLQNAGREFRLQWFRNNREEIYNQLVRSDDPDYIHHEIRLPKGNYYDVYQARISESDQPCLMADHYYSGSFQPAANFAYHPASYVRPGTIRIKNKLPDQNICENLKVALVTEDIQYLDRKFQLVWYQKKNQDSIPLGFYAYPNPASTSTKVRNLQNLYGYADAQACFDNQFPIYVNGDSEFQLRQGDTVFYIVRTTNSCLPGRNEYVRSDYFPIEIKTMEEAEVELDFLSSPTLCAGTSVQLQARIKGDGGEGLCFWTFNGEQISPEKGWYNPEGRRDILTIPHVQEGDSLVLNVTSNYSCSQGFPVRKTMVFRNLEPAMQFSVSSDTVLCEGEQPPLEFEVRSEEELQVQWSRRLEDLENAPDFVGKKWAFTPEPVSAYVYYMLTSESGCTLTDSIHIDFRDKVEPEVVLGYSHPMPWCRSDSNYLYLKGDNWGENPVVEWEVFTGRETMRLVRDTLKIPSTSVPIDGWKVTPILTTNLNSCMDNRVKLPAIDLKIYERPSVATDTLVQLCADEVNLTAHAYSPIDPDGEMGYTYRWTMDDQEKEGASATFPLDATRYFDLEVGLADGYCPPTSVRVKVEKAVSTQVKLDILDPRTGEAFTPVFCPGTDSMQVRAVLTAPNWKEDASLTFLWRGSDLDLKTGRFDTLLWVKKSDRMGAIYYNDTLSCENLDGRKHFTFCSVDRFEEAEPVDYQLTSDLTLCGPRLVVLEVSPLFATYRWTVENSSETSSTHRLEITPEASLNAFLRMEDAHGCPYYDTVTVFMVDESGTTNQRLHIGVRALRNGDFKTSDFQYSGDTVVSCNPEYNRLSIYIDPKNTTDISAFDSVTWYRNGEKLSTFPMEGHPSSLSLVLKNGDEISAVAGSKLECVKVKIPSNTIPFKTYPALDIRTYGGDGFFCPVDTVELGVRVKNPEAGDYHIEWRAENSSEVLSRTEILRTPAYPRNFYVEAFQNPICRYRDSVQLSLLPMADLSMEVVARAQDICGADTHWLAVRSTATVDTVEWLVNGVPMQKLTRKQIFKYYVQDSARITARGWSNATCVSNNGFETAPLVLYRKELPVMQRLRPQTGDTTLCKGAEVIMEYAASSDGKGVWYRGDELLAEGCRLAMIAEQSATYRFEWSEPGKCTLKDSVRVEVLPQGDSMQMTVTVRSLNVCGEEQHAFALRTSRRVDSVEWFVNGVAVATLDRKTVFRHYVEDSAEVYARAWNYCGCMVNNGLQSPTFKVYREDYPELRRLHPVAKDTLICSGSSVLIDYAADVPIFGEWYADGRYMGEGNFLMAVPFNTTDYVFKARTEKGCVTRDTVSIEVVPQYKPSARLVADKEFVCGEGEVTYSLTDRYNVDSYSWYVNGEWVSDEEVLHRAVTYRPESGETPDSVYALMKNWKNECMESETVRTNVLAIEKAYPPQVQINPMDTAVEAGTLFKISATGVASHYEWEPKLYVRVNGGSWVYAVIHRPQLFTLKAWNREGCFDMDSVQLTIRPEEILPPPLPEDEYTVFIPNTILLSATRYEDKVFKVYGPEIQQVEMEIHDMNGKRVYKAASAQPALPVWTGRNQQTGETKVGTYSYNVRVIFNNKTGKTYQGQVTVIN